MVKAGSHKNRDVPQLVEYFAKGEGKPSTLYRFNEKTVQLIKQ